jgi:hypothetical protein
VPSITFWDGDFLMLMMIEIVPTNRLADLLPQWKPHFNHPISTRTMW